VPLFQLLFLRGVISRFIDVNLGCGLPIAPATEPSRLGNSVDHPVLVAEVGGKLFFRNSAV